MSWTQVTWDEHGKPRPERLPPTGVDLDVIRGGPGAGWFRTTEPCRAVAVEGKYTLMIADSIVDFLVDRPTDLPEAIPSPYSNQNDQMWWRLHEQG